VINDTTMGYLYVLSLSQSIPPNIEIKLFKMHYNIVWKDIFAGKEKTSYRHKRNCDTFVIEMKIYRWRW